MRIHEHSLYLFLVRNRSGAPRLTFAEFSVAAPDQLSVLVIGVPYLLAVKAAACCDEIKCACCGKTFLDYRNKKRRYCSHECYIRDRFWRKEDGREPYVPPKER